MLRPNEMFEKSSKETTDSFPQMSAVLGEAAVEAKRAVYRLTLISRLREEWLPTPIP
jgi:hypothetical protein